MENYLKLLGNLQMVMEKEVLPRIYDGDTSVYEDFVSVIKEYPINDSLTIYEYGKKYLKKKGIYINEKDTYDVFYEFFHMYEYLLAKYRYDLLKQNIFEETQFFLHENIYAVQNFHALTHLLNQTMIEIPEEQNIKLSKISIHDTLHILKEFMRFLSPSIYQVFCEKYQNGKMVIHNVHDKMDRYSYLDYPDKWYYNKVYQLLNAPYDENIQDIYYFVHEFFHMYFEANEENMIWKDFFAEFPSVFFECFLDLFLEKKYASLKEEREKYWRVRKLEMSWNSVASQIFQLFEDVLMKHTLNLSLIKEEECDLYNEILMDEEGGSTTDAYLYPVAYQMSLNILKKIKNGKNYLLNRIFEVIEFKEEKDPFEIISYLECEDLFQGFVPLKMSKEDFVTLELEKTKE